MIVEIGHYALALALARRWPRSSCRSGARARRVGADGRRRSAALGQLLLVGMAFAALAYAHLASDFSVLNVAENSHSAMPAIYKFSGVWGNHEGSMLLWSLILALFGGWLPLRRRAAATPARRRAGGAGPHRRRVPRLHPVDLEPVRAAIAGAFRGRDLNPVLQDPGLAIHPPLLYLGYVGFSIVFSFAAAALIEGRIDAAWARFVRPFTLVAWSFLTLGIAMAPTGPITRWAGAASGSGTRSRTPR